MRFQAGGPIGCSGLCLLGLRYGVAPFASISMQFLWERYPVSPETDSMSSRLSSRGSSCVVSPTVPVVTSMLGTAL